MKQIYVVGLGPGAYDAMTFEADSVLRDCEVIVGYNVYVDLIRERYSDKEFVCTGMTKETERCMLAYEAASRGRTTAMVCSGDSGVYGMAGIMLELNERYPEVSVTVVPGITAALSGGAVLGAPLGHDFAVISLSDLLTPWETIAKRLRGAAMSDMVICIYNPCSKKRRDYLMRACDIIMEFASPRTVCGYVKNIGRDGETGRVLTLRELRDEILDMFTTVFIGNSSTVRIDDRMVTPRGYKIRD